MQAQDARSQEAPAAEGQQGEAKGMPPRTAPTEYQFQGKAGAVTIGAEFMGHSVPTPDATYTTEDYVVVEAGLFGAPQSHLKLAVSDFTLRINGRKTLQPNQPYELVFKSLKDPEWEPPSKDKSKGSLSAGGSSGPSDSLPVVVHMPIERRRAMEQRVQRSAMLEGDRPLPQAGLLFFDYRGKPQSIRSLELIYNGAAGSTVIPMQP